MGTGHAEAQAKVRWAGRGMDPEPELPEQGAWRRAEGEPGPQASVLRSPDCA